MRQPISCAHEEHPPLTGMPSPCTDMSSLSQNTNPPTPPPTHTQQQQHNTPQQHAYVLKNTEISSKHPQNFGIIERRAEQKELSARACGGGVWIACGLDRDMMVAALGCVTIIVTDTQAASSASTIVNYVISPTIVSLLSALSSMQQQHGGSSCP